MSEFRRDHGLRAVRFALRDFFINRRNRARLVQHDMSLVASDCTGGGTEPRFAAQVQLADG